MRSVKNFLILILALLTCTLSLPKLSLAQQGSHDTPQHQPQSWSTPEKEIPTVKEKKSSGWTWLILLALIGGAAAAAGGGGGDESSSSGGGGETGSYTGTW